MIDPPSCPHCSGTGRSLVHVNRGDQPHTWERQPCRTCAGHGLISREQADRIAEGERRREDRKARGLSLREEAARLGVKPWALSDIENGRTNP
jgi:DnaJ-class molecular chaperone